MLVFGVPRIFFLSATAEILTNWVFFRQNLVIQRRKKVDFQDFLSQKPFGQFLSFSQNRCPASRSYSLIFFRFLEFCVQNISIPLTRNWSVIKGLILRLAYFLANSVKKCFLGNQKRYLIDSFSIVIRKKNAIFQRFYHIHFFALALFSIFKFKKSCLSLSKRQI